ncbi:ketopantoate reductase [Endozoicomonas sp. NE35]
MIVRNREHSINENTDKKAVLTLTRLDKTESCHPVSVVTADEITAPIHQLIVCTKASDALTAMNSISPVLAKHCNVLLLQNGMGSQEAVAEAFPAQNIWIWLNH